MKWYALLLGVWATSWVPLHDGQVSATELVPRQVVYTKRFNPTGNGYVDVTFTQTVRAPTNEERIEYDRVAADMQSSFEKSRSRPSKQGEVNLSDLKVSASKDFEAIREVSCELSKGDETYHVETLVRTWIHKKYKTEELTYKVLSCHLEGHRLYVVEQDDGATLCVVHDHVFDPKRATRILTVILERNRDDNGAAQRLATRGAIDIAKDPKSFHVKLGLTDEWYMDRVLELPD